MNNNLRSIHLGAPLSIEGGDAPNLETLDVQITEHLESITIHGNTGTKSPFERAADLLHQQEVEMSDAEGIRPYADENNEYWELDCIISDGVSWIDTGIIPINQQMKTEVLIPQVASGIIVGTNEARTSTVYGLCVSAYSFCGVVHGDHRHITVPLNTRVQVIIDKQFAVGDTTDPSPFIESGVLPTTNLLLFNGNTTINSSTNAKVPNWKMYSFSLKDLGTNELVRDLVPAMHIKTREVGMYDKITKQFLHAQGGGQFGYEFKYDDSVSLNIPDDAILNGGSTTCEIKTDGTTLPPTDFYWQLTNINPESTGHPTIDQQGNITIEPDTWAEFDINVKRYADASWKQPLCILGIGNSYDGLNTAIVNNPRLGSAIVNNPRLIGILENLNSSEYNYVSYIKNNRGCINTTYVPTSNNFGYMVKYSTSSNYTLIGVKTNNSAAYVRLYRYSGNMQYTYASSNATIPQSNDVVYVCKFNWMDSNDVLMDGVSYTLTKGTAINTVSPVLLFAYPSTNTTAWEPNTSETNLNAIIYLAAISEGDELARVMIPCIRKSDGTVGVHDLVTNEFFGNYGRGSIIAGEGEFDYNNLLNLL